MLAVLQLMKRPADKEGQVFPIAAAGLAEIDADEHGTLGVSHQWQGVCIGPKGLNMGKCQAAALQGDAVALRFARGAANKPSRCSYRTFQIHCLLPLLSGRFNVRLRAWVYVSLV